MDPSAPGKKQARYHWIIGIMLLITLPLVGWSISKSLDAGKKISIPLPLLSTLRPEAMPLEAFSLTDQQHRPFTLDRLSGKWSFLFFGYTACPDVCPTTLTEMANIADILAGEEWGDDAQFIFVSVDPERDDLDHLREYMAYFNPAFIGLTGSQAQLETLTKQLNILAIRNDASSAGDYQINHTSSILLIDPKGRWFASFSPPVDAKRITRQFKLLIDYYRESG